MSDAPAPPPTPENDFDPHRFAVEPKKKTDRKFASIAITLGFLGCLTAAVLLFGKWQLTSYFAGLEKAREAVKDDETTNPTKAPARKPIDFPKFDNEIVPERPLTTAAKPSSDMRPGVRPGPDLYAAQPIPLINNGQSTPPRQADVPVIAKAPSPGVGPQVPKEEVPMMLDSIPAPVKNKLGRDAEQGGTSPALSQDFRGVYSVPVDGLPIAGPLAALRAMQAATAQINGTSTGDQRRSTVPSAAAAAVDVPGPLKQAAMKAVQTTMGGVAQAASASAGGRAPDPSPAILRDTQSTAVARPRTVEEMAAIRAQQSAISATAQSTSANVGDRSRAILRGSYIECILESQLISNIPGITACVVPTNVYSDNGKRLLISKGSKLVGEYSATVKVGDSRFGVLWQRIKTPEGVVIDVDSGSADGVGAMGQTGNFDSHWAERLGTAFMFSIVADGISTLLVPRQTGTTTPPVAGAAQTSAVQQSATVDLAQNFAKSQVQAAMAIAPTFFKNRGERISVFVNRDLWFN